MALRQNTETLAEMQQILRLAAEPCQMHDNAKSLIARAAAVLHLTYRRAYSLWYGAEKTRVRAEEAARLRAERERLLQLKIERLEREIATVRRQIADEESAGLARGGDHAAGAPASLAGGVC